MAKPVMKYRDFMDPRNWDKGKPESEKPEDHGVILPYTKPGFETPPDEGNILPVLPPSEPGPVVPPKPKATRRKKVS